MDKNTISITLRGDALKKGKWIEWYDYISLTILKLGYEKTHIAMESDAYATRKIVTVSRKEKQILQMINEGVQPTCFSIYSLPEDYKIATFDYNILAVRTRSYFSIIFNQYDFEKIDADNFISTMKSYIEFENGEIYKMDREEVPLIYAAQANSINEYKTLSVLKKIE